MQRSPALRLPVGLLVLTGVAAWGCAPAATNDPSIPPATPAPASASTPAPLASARPPEPIAGGRITLTDDACSWEGNPGSVDGAAVEIGLHNETAAYGAFFVHRLKSEFTWQDGQDAIAAIQLAIAAGDDWPNWSTRVSIVEGDAEAAAGSTGLATVPAIAGTYGVVCSANTSASGEVLSVFLAGPLEVTD
jgi:hypothetical protein